MDGAWENLFEGASLAKWRHADGSPARWLVQDGVVEVVPGSGNLVTQAKWSDFELHLEFWLPLMQSAHGQDRANSGVFLQGRYEIQILDSFHNPTYPGGECGAIYKRYSPGADAIAAPEQWQVFDIRFAAPNPNSGSAARLWVHHNNRLIHDGVQVSSPTGGHLDDAIYEPGPLMLQDHGCPVRFRDVKIRPLLAATLDKL